MASFTLVIGHDEETGTLMAAVPELPGCYIHADSLRELAGNAQRAIREYLESHTRPPMATKFLGVQSISLE
ncbi:MAG: type II toxin-antitoxin system HicB family antitoxin [Myxococcales bacterium]|nr:MAG: type II toxin-antitoxin system HicB family antitoxin [Myxococcales bacterium]